jgi:putative NADH-flavin reductase
MHVAIFGSTGLTGKHLVPYSLESGHTLAVLVRDPSKLNIQDDQKLTAYKGDCTKYDDVSQTIKGADIVVNLLGHAKGSPKDIMVQSTQNILKAMKQHNVKTLITMTTAGVKQKEDYFSLGQNFMHFYLSNFEKDQMDDHQAMCELIEKETEIDWVIVRAARLTHSERTKKYHTGEMGKFTVNAYIARADVADFINNMLNAPDLIGGFNHKMPFINY